MHPEPIERARSHRGFTMVEMIVSIVLLGILATVLVPLFHFPMTAQADATRRADLTSELDLTLTKMRLDLAQAIPGSIRVTQVAGRQYLEYMETRAVARFRYQNDSGAPAAACPAACGGAAVDRDRLQFAVLDGCVATLGPLVGTNPVLGDQVVVSPMNASPWAINRAAFQSVEAAVSGSRCVRMAATAFAAPNANLPYLYIASSPVSYECNPATGLLTRYWGYPFAALQRTVFNGVASAPLARSVSSCRFLKPAAPVSSGYVIGLSLQLSRTVNGVVGAELAEGHIEFSEREVAR